MLLLYGPPGISDGYALRLLLSFSAYLNLTGSTSGKLAGLRKEELENEPD